MIELERLREEIAKIVKKRLGAGLISDVLVKPDEGYGGDPILRIRVIFDETAGKPDVKKLVSLPRQLQPMLHNKADDRFPILSYISKSEFLEDVGA